MKRLGLAALCVSLLLACEKEVPFEITRPAAPTGAAAPTPTPSFDASVASIDAQVAVSVDSGAVQELPTGTFTKAGLLKSIADCSVGRYREFSERAGALRTAAQAWNAAPGDEALRLAAQSAWRNAMESWQQSELFRFGPSGPASEPGGKDLRSEIYFWPDINNCLVDLQLVSKSYERRPLNLSLSAKGLGALDYLLSYTGTDQNSCAASTTINTGEPSPWKALTPDEIVRRRAAYALAVAEDLTLRANELLDAWDPAKGNFHAQLSQAGAGSATYASEHDAFNVVDNALFYLDKELKDYKVAIPVGLSVECMAERCPERVESRYSFASNSNIVHNLRGFRLLFQGCGPSYSGLGFDDYLRAINQGALADRMQQALIAAEQSAATLPAPLEALLASDPARAIALHAAIKAVTDPLKMEFVTSLNLELPTAAQGDND
jgi:uncharacterized protein